MQQLSLFGGEGPLGQMVADLGLLKTSKSMWAGNIGAMVGDLTDIFGSMTLAYELEDLPLLVGEPACEVLVEPTKDEFLRRQRALALQLVRVFGLKEGDEGTGLESSTDLADGPGLPTGSELFQLLVRAGAFSDSPPNPKQLGAIGWSPFSYFFREWEQIAHNQVDEFRKKLRPVFGQFGTKGLRFERLEASLHEAIEYRQSLLFNRIPARLELVFREKFGEAMKGLPANPEVEDLEAWFEPGAWLKQYILLLYRTLNAIQQFRLERLSALVEAACHFEES